MNPLLLLLLSMSTGVVVVVLTWYVMSTFRWTREDSFVVDRCRPENADGFTSLTLAGPLTINGLTHNDEMHYLIFRWLSLQEDFDHTRAYAAATGIVQDMVAVGLAVVERDGDKGDG